MSKASPTTYRVGSIGEFAAWTKRVVQDPSAGKDVPRRWLAAGTAATPDLGDPLARRRSLHLLFMRAQANARRKGLAFNLTPEFVESLWKDGRCAVTGIPFSLQSYEKALVKHPFAPSIDRESSAGGYTQGNVRLVCVAANFGLGEWGDEVFLRLAEGAIKKQRELRSHPNDADRNSAYQERIAAVEGLLATATDESERARLRRRIAALKRALKLGPAGLKAAAAKAKASRVSR